MKWFPNLCPGTRGRPKGGQENKQKWRGQSLRKGKGTLEPAPDTPFPLSVPPPPALGITVAAHPHPTCKNPPTQWWDNEESSVLSHWEFLLDCPELSPPWNALFMLSSWLCLLASSWPPRKESALDPLGYASCPGSELPRDPLHLSHQSHTFLQLHPWCVEKCLTYIWLILDE